MVSVCLDCYNGEHYIGEQISSILREFRDSDELVISDSTFSSLQFRKKRMRLKYYALAFLFIPLFFFQIHIVCFTKLNKSDKYNIGMIYSYNSQFDPKEDELIEEAYGVQESWVRLKKKTTR